MALRRAASLVGALSAAVGMTAASACVEGSGFQYVSNRNAGAFVRMPDDWEVFGDREIREAMGDVETLEWAVAFDASPEPSIDRFATLDTTSPYPSGMVRVIQLTEEESAFFSVEVLRNVLVPVDQGMDDGTVVDVDIDDHSPKGFEGEQLSYTLVKPDGSRYRIIQTGLVNESLTTVYLFAAGCEERCFSKHRRVIDELVSSWKVRSS